MDIDVAAVLDAARPAAELTTEVIRDTPHELDLGCFTLFESVPLDDSEAVSEASLKEMTRDNVQLFINALFSLPTRRDPLGVIADLPSPKTPLPREKPLPKLKPQTRWEKFAKEKGIVKHKRSRKVFDEQAQEWRPRYGFNRANDDQKDWLIEVPKNSDMFEDQFEKRRQEKTARIAKNQTNQLKNLERTAAQRIKASLPVPKDMPGKNPLRAVRKVELNRMLTSSKTSTASMGRFDEAIKNEPKIKTPGQRRKFDPATGALTEERQRASGIAESLLKRAANGDPIKSSSRAAAGKKKARKQQ